MDSSAHAFSKSIIRNIAVELREIAVRMRF